MKPRKPNKEFAPKKKEAVRYKNVSYRLPVNVVNELAKYVDKDDSASSLVAEVLTWALPGLKKHKGG